MAVIGNIQKNSYLLLIVIGLAMLAFIFTDSFKNFGGGEEPIPSGVIYGEEINENDLRDLEQDYTERDKQNFSYQGKEFDDEARNSALDQAFNEMIRRKLMGKELNALGLNVSSAELNDMIIGEHIHAWVSQVSMFKNNLGQYEKDSVIKFLDNLEATPDGNDTALYSRWKEARVQWNGFEKELKDARSTDKYVSLVKKGLYVNTLEAKDAYKATKESREISFVLQRYAGISEEEVGFTDDDIRTYYNAHKNDVEYNQAGESAEIQFVQFPVDFSEDDLNRTSDVLEKLKAGFKETENNIYYMATKGEDKFYSDTTAFEMGASEMIIDDKNKVFQYPQSVDELIQKSNIGDVIGPFKSVSLEKNETKLVIAKLNGFELQEQAWVRHILISSTGADNDVASAKADSIKNVIKKKNNFVEMVTLFSDDPGSKDKGGEYKWFKKGQMVAEFEEVSFNSKVGSIEIAKTQFGYHIIEVLGREERKLPKLAPITKLVKPGIETIKEVENQAYELINEIADLKGQDSSFFKVVNEKNVISSYAKLYMASRFVTGFEKSDKIKKFVFAKDAEEGDVSEPILDNNVIKVAYLINKISEGAPEFDDVKKQMRSAALNEKKAQAYLEIMSGTPNLNEIVGRLISGKVETATVNFGAATIPGVGGNEAELVGTVFSLSEDQKGAMLAPIQGATGVYVIVLDNIVQAPESDDYVIDGEALLNTRNGSADQNVMRALRDKAGVVDNRLKIESQGR